MMTRGTAYSMTTESLILATPKKTMKSVQQAEMRSVMRKSMYSSIPLFLSSGESASAIRKPMAYSGRNTPVLPPNQSQNQMPRTVGMSMMAKCQQSGSREMGEMVLVPKISRFSRLTIPVRRSSEMFLMS